MKVNTFQKLFPSMTSGWQVTSIFPRCWWLKYHESLLPSDGMAKAASVEHLSVNLILLHSERVPSSGKCP